MATIKGVQRCTVLPMKANDSAGLYRRGIELFERGD